MLDTCPSEWHVDLLLHYKKEGRKSCHIDITRFSDKKSFYSSGLTLGLSLISLRNGTLSSADREFKSNFMALKKCAEKEVNLPSSSFTINDWQGMRNQNMENVNKCIGPMQNTFGMMTVIAFERIAFRLVKKIYRHHHILYWDMKCFLIVKKLK